MTHLWCILVPFGALSIFYGFIIDGILFPIQSLKTGLNSQRLYVVTRAWAAYEITNGLVPKERICVLSMSYYWYSVLSLSFAFAQFFCFCSRHRSSRHHVTLSELLKICQKLQYREKSSSKQIKNKQSALSLNPADA